MGLARKCTDALFSVLEARIGGAASLASEAFCVVSEERVGLDAVDREVLRDALAVATRLLSRLFVAMRDDLDDDESAALAGVAEIAPRLRPCVERGRRTTQAYVAELISLAMDRTSKARSFTRRFDRKPDSTIDIVLTTSIRRLEIALHVLRSQIEEPPLERDVAAYRELIRRRLGGEGTSV